MNSDVKKIISIGITEQDFLAISPLFAKQGFQLHKSKNKLSEEAKNVICILYHTSSAKILELEALRSFYPHASIFILISPNKISDFTNFDQIRISGLLSFPFVGQAVNDLCYFLRSKSDDGNYGVGQALDEQLMTLSRNLSNLKTELKNVIHSISFNSPIAENRIKDCESNLSEISDSVYHLLSERIYTLTNNLFDLIARNASRSFGDDLVLTSINIDAKSKNFEKSAALNVEDSMAILLDKIIIEVGTDLKTVLQKLDFVAYSESTAQVIEITATFDPAKLNGNKLEPILNETVDSINDTLKDINGNLNVKFSNGVTYFRWVFRSRNASFSEELLTVRSHDILFGIPLRRILDIRPLQRSDLTLIGNAYSIQFEGKTISVCNIQEILPGEDKRPKKSVEYGLAIVIAGHHSRYAILVDEVIDQSESVVKSLVDPLSKLVCIEGVSVPDNQTYVWVLNVYEFEIEIEKNLINYEYAA